MKKFTNIENDANPIPRRFLTNKLISVGFLALLVMLWEIIIRVNDVKEYILPAPTAILKAFVEHRELLWMHTKATLL